MATHLRPATDADIDALCALWHKGWHDAHGTIVPAAWSRHRDLDDFRRRTPALIPIATIATKDKSGSDRPGNIDGFISVEGNYITNLFVAADRRGTGLGTALLTHAERFLATDGHAVARLDCRHGNHRAKQFYEASGWFVIDDIEHHETVDGVPLVLHAWEMEKPLTR